MDCNKCGKNNPDDILFCVKCGNKLYPDAGPVKETPGVGYGLDEGSTVRKNLDFKRFVVGIVGLVIAISAFFAVSWATNYFFGEPEPDEILAEKHPVVYMKDGNLYLSPYGSKKTYLSAENCEVGNTLSVDEDGKRMFFQNLGDASLNYKKASDKTDKATPLAQNVTGYDISRNGKKVLYSSHGSLYYSNLKENRMIAADVTEFALSKDEKYAVYSRNDGVYICSLKKGGVPERVDTGITFADLVSGTDKYSKIYYLKDGALFSKKKGKAPVSIATGVSNAYFVKKNLYAEKDSTLYLVKGTKLKKLLEGVSVSSHYEDEPAFVAIQTIGTNETIFVIRGSKVYETALKVQATTDVRFSKDSNRMFTVENGDMYQYKIGLSKLGDKKFIRERVKNIRVLDKYIMISTGLSGLGVYDGRHYIHLTENGSVYEYERGTFYYIDNDTEQPTLMKMRNNKKTAVDTNVYDMDVRSHEYVVYMKNYNAEKELGDVYYLRGKRKINIDQKATRIIRTAEDKIAK